MVGSAWFLMWLCLGGQVIHSAIGHLLDTKYWIRAYDVRCFFWCDWTTLLLVSFFILLIATPKAQMAWSKRSPMKCTCFYADEVVLSPLASDNAMPLTWCESKVCSLSSSPTKQPSIHHVPTSKVLDTDVVLLSDPFIHLGNDADLEVNWLILVVGFYHFLCNFFSCAIHIIFLEYHHFHPFSSRDVVSKSPSCQICRPNFYPFHSERVLNIYR